VRKLCLSRCGRGSRGWRGLGFCVGSFDVAGDFVSELDGEFGKEGDLLQLLHRAVAKIDNQGCVGGKGLNRGGGGLSGVNWQIKSERVPLQMRFRGVEFSGF
jgi:hypothetical protein